MTSGVVDLERGAGVRNEGDATRSQNEARGGVVFQPVTMAATMDEEGLLVFSEQKLIGVLVRLADELHEEDRGNWFLEAAFGGLADRSHQLFRSPDEAKDWFERVLLGPTSP